MAPTHTTPEGMTQQLAKALAHPLRVRILTSLNRRTSSPNQLAQELDEPLGNVSYHVKALLEYGCVELVKLEPRRGAVEHFYRATARAFLDDSDWTRIPPAARRGVAGVALEAIGRDAAAALREGTIDARPGARVARLRLTLDEAGWEELSELLDATLERATRIGDAAAERRSAAAGIPTTVALLHFEVPPAAAE